MLTNEDRRQIIDFFLKVIARVADKEYQKRVWIRGAGPEADDFDEAVCHFFHEGDGILEKYKDFGINEQQYSLLVKFRNQFQMFSDKHDLPEEFIDTPEWESIMSMAKEILRAFDYKNIKN